MATARKIFEETPPAVLSRSLFRLGVLLIALLIYAVFSLLHDFARAARRHAPDVGAWRAYSLARQVLSGSWLRALGLFFFWLFAGGTALLLLVALEWESAAISGFAILAIFVLQIGILAVRSAVRVAAWGSYIAFLEPRARNATALLEKPLLTTPQVPSERPF